MENCPSCGTPVSAADWRCPECGAVFATDASLLPAGSVIDPQAGRVPQRRASDHGGHGSRRHHGARRHSDPPTLGARLRGALGMAPGTTKRHRLKVRRSTIAIVVVLVGLLLVAVFILGRMTG